MWCVRHVASRVLPLLSADPWRVFAVNQADWQPAAARRKPQGGRRAADLLPPLTDPTKKTLVLDLDETLVHSSFQAVRADAGVSSFTIPVEIEQSIHDINVIRRPGLDEFMRAVGSIYEVVVFTASLGKYANPVLDTIDTHNVVQHRLFREHCVFEEGNYVKVRQHRRSPPAYDPPG